MEDNKQSKKSSINSSQDQNPKKLSYEQLQNIAGQLQQQNMQLRRALSEQDYTNAFKRLDYLFKVMEFAHMFSDDFISRITEEIEATITLPVENKDKTEDTEKEK